MAGVGEDDVSIRSRIVKVDLDLFVNTASRTDGRNVIELDLFPDEIFSVELDHFDDAYGGGLIRSGSDHGEPQTHVVLSVVGEAVHGTIERGERLYRVAYAGNGVHRVSEADATQFKPCGIDEKCTVHSPGSPHADGDTNTEGSPDIMVMVVYSTAAKNAVGGTNGMLSKINLAITETNSGYTNSLVDQDLVLAHTEEMVGYTEPSSFSQILTDLKGKTDGKMDGVHALRDQYAADAVTMICRNSQYCGIAYLMTNVSPSFESYAFNVVNYSCATGYYSFGHELGHNFGCAHDPGNAGSAAYNYSYGYRTPDSRYRTIMAYSPGTRIKYFSNPSVTFNGYTMGASLQDNARSMNNTANTVAAWRGDPPSDPDADFSASPTSGDEDLFVAFTDASFGTGLSDWSWNFGDGATSTVQNPAHTYVDPGTYTVALSVTGANGNDTEAKLNYIVVNDVADASTTTRNGSGVNPDIFTSTNLPVLGTTWISEVDAGSLGVGGLVMVFVYSAPSPDWARASVSSSSILPRRGCTPTSTSSAAASPTTGSRFPATSASPASRASPRPTSTPSPPAAADQRDRHRARPVAGPADEPPRTNRSSRCGVHPASWGPPEPFVAPGEGCQRKASSRLT